MPPEVPVPDLIAPQPDPIANDLPASWDLVVADFEGAYGQARCGAGVIKDMRDRDNFGFNKYGTRIQPQNGRDNLVDAYQEILDGLVYFRTALYEINNDPEPSTWTRSVEQPQLLGLYRDGLKMCLHLRQLIEDRT